MKIVKYFYGNPTFTETKITVVDEDGYSLSETVIERKPNARITVCGIFDTETKELKIGVSRCSSKDRFVKEVGRELALKRATNKPIVQLTVFDEETISSVFFSQAKLLDMRYSAIDYFKF